MTRLFTLSDAAAMALMAVLLPLSAVLFVAPSM